MAQQTDAVTEQIDDELAGAVKTFGVDEDEAEAFADFIEAGLSSARDMLADNLADARMMDKADGDTDVSDVLNPENVRDVEWEATRFGGKRITIWLRDAPIWANTASTRSFGVGDINARNRDVQAVIDVRPF